MSLQLDFSLVSGKRVALIGDAMVMGLYGKQVMATLEAAGARQVWSLPFVGGEKNKSVATWQRLLKQLARVHADRQTIIVGLGGGISTDVAGFVAATYMRGVPLWLVPTSLLAMIDAAVGGKTAVNSPLGKNLIGAFYPAEKRLLEPAFLQTLPAAELANGWSELLKIAFIADAGLYDKIEQQVELKELIAPAIALKEEIVAADLRDHGRRQILNFGHTVGHALEKCCRRHPLSHGQAVAIGMVVAATLAVEKGLLVAADRDRLVLQLEKHGLPVRVPVDIGRARRYLLNDKKNSMGTINMVLPTAVGSGALFPVTMAELTEVWHACADR